MKHKSQMFAAVLLGSLSLTGCMKDKEPASVAVPDKATGLPDTKPAAEALPAKEMTHVVTADQPCYLQPAGESCGTIKAGTKVLLLVPATLAQIETADGKTLYTRIDAIEPIGVPAEASAAPAPVPPALRPEAAKPAPAPKVEPATKPAEPAKAMTHVLTKDQPFFTSMPMAAGPKPAGTIKAGTKVLLLIPGSYAQVETTAGKQIYTAIEGIDLIDAK